MKERETGISGGLLDKIEKSYEEIADKYGEPDAFKQVDTDKIIEAAEKRGNVEFSKSASLVTREYLQKELKKSLVIEIAPGYKVKIPKEANFSDAPYWFFEKRDKGDMYCYPAKNRWLAKCCILSCFGLVDSCGLCK